MARTRRGASYRKRVSDINRIYGEYVKSGLSNRELWLRYIYPVYAISERTFYNILKAPAPSSREHFDYPSLFKDDSD